MAVVTHKCPNCSAELTFRPGTDAFVCDYCKGEFTKKDLENIADKQASVQEQPKNEPALAEELVGYRCPSCGAEIMTDETTAATFCYYCHNPVAITGRLAGQYQPDKVVPFAYDKAEAQNRFFSWCRKKAFLDRGFFGESQIEKFSGVYFPYWLVDAKKEVHWQAKAQKLRVWRTKNIEYTETSVYELSRLGDMDFFNYDAVALQREETALLAGILPYQYNKTEDFSSLYLSGFLAERRNVEKEDLSQKIKEDMAQFGQVLLRDTASGFTSVQVQSFSSNEKKSDWRYLLLPAWVLTYRYKEKLYYFAMNGQTGKIAGQLPVDKKRLAALFAGVFGAVSVLLMLGGYFLW